MKRKIFFGATFLVIMFAGCISSSFPQNDEYIKNESDDTKGSAVFVNENQAKEKRNSSALSPAATPVLTPEEALVVQKNSEQFFYEEKISSLMSDVAGLKKAMPTFSSKPTIVCWGDSLTARGGWTDTLADLCSGIVYNAGTGGENAKTIMARQGADVMTINHITIPAACEPVTIAVRATDGGILTEAGNRVTPLLQRGDDHVNPVMIGNIEGSLKWTGKNHADMTGTWTFTRSKPGDEIVIDRPTAIRTFYDRMHNNANEIMIIFMGQNGNESIESLVNMHRKMIDHFKGKEYIILGLSSGSKKTRENYETAMKNAFGRRFISLREYLATPIFDDEGKIVSCYGLADQGLEPGVKEYDGPTYVALEEIAAGTVPHQILVDTVHYTSETTTVIGKMLYKKMRELNILP